MVRAITALAAALCVAAPVLAADKDRAAGPSDVILAQGGTGGSGGAGGRPGMRDDRRRMDGGRMDGGRMDGRGDRIGVDEEGGVIRENVTARGATLNPYPVYERILPARFYRAGYRLSPREYHRLRAMGFSQKEVYMIANASNATFLPTRVFEDAIYRGLYARGISLEYNIDPYHLTRIRPEWRTEAWARATREKAISGDKLNVWW